MHKMRRMISLLLIVFMLTTVTGCGKNAVSDAKDVKTAEDDTIKIREPKDEEKKENKDNKDKSEKHLFSASNELTGASSDSESDGKKKDDAFMQAYRDYAFRLFQENYRQHPQTGMISPFSLYMALGMLGNAAGGDTKTELEQLLGLPMDENNRYAKAWMNQLEKDGAFSGANAIWIQNSFSKNVERDFLKRCADYYKASVIATDFLDPMAVGDVNQWVNDKTNGMIHKLYDEIDPMTVSILMNAIAFEAKWQEAFREENIHDGEFTHENGSVTIESMMCGTAESGFFENEYCTGCAKDYMGGNFAFLALRPKDGVAISTLVDWLSEENFAALMQSAKHGNVRLELPSFEEEYSVSMVPMLKNMGVNRAFLFGTADFTAFSKMERLCVSDVLQKTFISVDAKGTRAAAVTGITIVNVSLMNEYSVTFDRSFVYMIVDKDGNLPVFMGIYQ